MARPIETLSEDAPLSLQDYTYFGLIPENEDGEPAIYDGDTVTLIIDLGMEQWVGPLHYRLYGIQAPEIRPLSTRKAGTAARDYLRELIQRYYSYRAEAGDWPGNGWWIGVRTHKKLRPKNDYRPRACRGKFGRWLVELIGSEADGPTRQMVQRVNLNKLMVTAGHAGLYLP